MKLKALGHIILLWVATVWLATSCGPSAHDDARRQVDSLNLKAYDWHYRNIDSVRQWTTDALSLARKIQYTEGVAEALNNLAFERFQQMDFDSVQFLAREIGRLTDSPTELLIADVMQMKVAQRTSDNQSFFRHRNHALRRARKLSRREGRLDEHARRRFAYGCGEMHIVASTYFYYLDQKERAIAEIREAEPFCRMSQDTAMWLNYCYMHGSGGLSEQSDKAAVAVEEFSYLMKCFWLAHFEGYRFFEANAEQSLASIFSDSVRADIVTRRQPEQVALLTTLFGEADRAMTLATEAYHGFQEYDDLYQMACALRTLGELSFEQEAYADAIDYYKKALSCVNLHFLTYYAPDSVLEPEQQPNLLEAFNPHGGEISVERQWMTSPRVKTVPEWIAGIRQQLSVAYSALDCKEESDYNRNIYLDLLDVTREDAELESRAAELQSVNQRQHLMIMVLIIITAVIGLLTYFLIRTHRRRTEAQNRLLRQKFQQAEDQAQQKQKALAEEQEQLREEQTATEMRLLRDKRLNVEKRAKLQLVFGIVPFLDRIINEVDRMKRRGELSEASLTYIGELTERITQYNELLTEWIQMEQGQLSLQLSSFSLRPLFDSLRKSHFAYDQKGLKLDVGETDLTVKADRALTLFMINTLADNARKFTPAGGTVSIQAAAGENEDGRYVEISVKDTGVGLTGQDIHLILDNKVYDADTIGRNDDTGQAVSLQGQKGFGFGLMNCKGIIEKYRKTNPLFRVCLFDIESRVGEGSRFFFRLPRVMVLLPLFLCHVPVLAARQPASSAHEARKPLQNQVYEYADSIYFCNLNGRYADAIGYAQAAIRLFNENHVNHTSNAQERIYLSDNGLEPIEFIWWQRQEKVDYSLFLAIRNEVAVAALALHDWPLYRYNNRIYTQLYKLSNQDATLEDYCIQTERSQQTRRIILVSFVTVLLFGVVAVYLFYFRPRIRFRRKVAQLSARRLEHFEQTNEAEHERWQSDFEMAEDELRRRLYEEGRLHVQNQIIDNCLSAIKHETMYYPGRIQQLLKRGGDLDTLSETVSYYKDIYTLLSTQASQQSEAVNFKRRNLTARELTAPLQRRFLLAARRAELEAGLDIGAALAGATFRGDPDLLAMLLDNLFEAEIGMTVSHGRMPADVLKMSLGVEADGRFIRVTFTNPAVALTADQLHDFFSPHEGSIPLLIVKQIIREHDTFLGHPGCRINAEADGVGHKVWFTLPLVQDNQTNDN